MLAMMQNYLRARGKGLGVTQIVYIIAILIGVALLLYVVFNFGEGKLQLIPE